LGNVSTVTGTLSFGDWAAALLKADNINAKQASGRILNRLRVESCEL
jgi:hypothetical protein